MTIASTARSGPVTRAERAPVPDLARGLALLGIAVANSAVHISGADLGAGQRPVDGSALDRVVDGFVSAVVDDRTRPMFALLFGYGFVMVLRRQESAGVPFERARALLLRRCLWLAVFGAVHIVLLFLGDILLTYALTGLALVIFLRRRDVVLLRWAAGLLVVSTLVVVGLEALAAATEGTTASGAGASGLPFDQDTVLGALLVRAIALAGTVVGSPLLVTLVLPLMLVGAVLARRRVLEAPHEHLPLLRRLVAVGLPVSVLGGVPYALVVARVWEPGLLARSAAAGLHAATGALGGIALAALVALVVGALTRRDGGRAPTPRGPARALAAVGERSLTCYLLQSVLFVLPLAPWAGGLGVGTGSAQVVAWAVGVWLVTAGVALALDAAGRAGPAEVLLRRLVYGPSPARRALPATASGDGADHDRP